jgi:transposase
MNFFQYRCELVARVPRADCPMHGAKLTNVPWAAPGSGFTLLFEALVMLLARQMPVSEVARVVGEEDTRLWRLIQRLVEAAHAAKDWSAVRAIAIDETSTRRGRCYATVILDMTRARSSFSAKGATARRCHALPSNSAPTAETRHKSAG